METFTEFFSFRDPNIVAVVLGSILLTASSAIVGTFTFLKKKALVGDAVAHAVLPGICLAFIISGNKNLFVLIIGALITGWLSLVIIDAISRESKLKEDTAIALVLSVFFGIGILLLTYIQHSGNATQTGLDSFLFGKAAALVGNDLKVFGVVAVVLILTIALFFKELKLISFDANYAASLGIPVRAMDLLLTSLTVFAVVTGIQAVGVVLMAAMLITPAAAARFWTDDVLKMTILAAVFGALAGLTGAYVSFVAPSMPTGPWIVMIISMIAMISFFFSPNRGILSRVLLQRRQRAIFMDENLLKALYQLGENDGNMFQSRSIEQINARREFLMSGLQISLRRLTKSGFLERSNGSWKFTQAGKTKGQRVVKLHRLWELYLSKYIKIADDHVHEDAETMEHIITPEIEKELERMLEYPTMDPHNKAIPS